MKTSYHKWIYCTTIFFLNINFQVLSIIDENTRFCRTAIMTAKWKYVKYVIILLIYSEIKLSSSRYCWPYERWEELLYPDIWFSYFIHSPLGDCGPCLRCMNLLKNCQDPGVFLVVMRGNGKCALSCVVELKGLIQFPLRITNNARNIDFFNLSQSD